METFENVYTIWVINSILLVHRHRVARIKFSCQLPEHINQNPSPLFYEATSRITLIVGNFRCPLLPNGTRLNCIRQGLATAIEFITARSLLGMYCSLVDLIRDKGSMWVDKTTPPLLCLKVHLPFLSHLQGVPRKSIRNVT